jgi:hypothetical protein
MFLKNDKDFIHLTLNKTWLRDSKSGKYVNVSYKNDAVITVNSRRVKLADVLAIADKLPEVPILPKK